MPTDTMNRVAGEIDNYIVGHGGDYRNWYIGIASDPRQRLFSDHNVDERNDLWIYRDAGTDTAARQIERYFLGKGCQGGKGGGDSTTRYVYAYRITRTTKE